MSAAVRNSFQEYDPRHRLIGVVVLVLLAIILLPMLLNKKPDDQIPAKDPVVMEIRKEGKKAGMSIAKEFGDSFYLASVKFKGFNQAFENSKFYSVGLFP